MAFYDDNLRSELDRDGVLTVTIDMPKRSMNVFSASMMDSLAALLDHVERNDAVRAVVLTSDKAAFIAGADLDMIRGFAEAARIGSTGELNALFGRLGRLFRRLELSPKPYVAAINGLALGGGLEVALACHRRVVVDDASAQLGLPEIKLGLLPGAGGTQRLPRRVGVEQGLRMLLSGEPVAPREALALGLVDAVVAADSLLDTARWLAREAVGARAAWDVEGYQDPVAAYGFGDAVSARARIAASLGISDEQRQFYPAYDAIMNCVIGGAGVPMSEACEHEMRIFVELMRNPVAGNMVTTLFLNKLRASKLGLLKDDSPYAQGSDALLPHVRAVRQKADALALGETDRNLACALAALRLWADGKLQNPELADVALVVRDLMPAYTGGAFTFLRQQGFAAIRARAQAAPPMAAELFDLRAIPAELP